MTAADELKLWNYFCQVVLEIPKGDTLMAAKLGALMLQTVRDDANLNAELRNKVEDIALGIDGE